MSKLHLKLHVMHFGQTSNYLTPDILGEVSRKVPTTPGPTVAHALENGVKGRAPWEHMLNTSYKSIIK